MAKRDLEEWYKMSFEAWDEGTDALPLDQEAAYLRLCHQMYRRHGPIPNDPKLHSRLFRCYPNRARHLVRKLIEAGKIRLTDDGAIENSRVLSVLDDRNARAKTSRANGAGGGRPPRSTGSTTPTHARDNAETTPTHARHMPDTTSTSRGDKPDTTSTSRDDNSHNMLKTNDTQNLFGFNDETQPKPVRVEKSREEKKDKSPHGRAERALSPVSRETGAVDPSGMFVDTLSPKAELYALAQEVFAKRDYGAITTALLKAMNQNVEHARAAVEQASQAANAKSYIWAVINKRLEENSDPGKIHGAL